MPAQICSRVFLRSDSARGTRHASSGLLGPALACGALMGVLFVTVPVTLAQPHVPQSAAEPPAAGHLERLDQPYIPVDRDQLPRSPGYRWHADSGRGFTVQVNVDAQGLNIVGDAANEPSIAIDPTNPSRMVIGWRQFDTINSNFRQAGWAYSGDGGQTWTFPGVIEPGHFRSDPVLDFDANGNFYYNSLTNEGGYQCKVFKSTNGGQTWDAGVFAQGGDKQWMTIDRTGGPGHGHIYATWNLVYSICSGDFTRSTNGGASFEPCSNVGGSPYWGTLAVAPNGALFACGTGVELARSSNAQFAGQTPTWDIAKTVNLGGSLVYSSGPNPGGLLGQVWIAVDHSGGPTHGYVYLLASVDVSGPDPLDVMFSRSTDGGQTWSTPIRVNDDPAGSNAWQWFGTLSVAPNGRLDAIWLDTRNNPGGYRSQLYYSFSEDGGLSWSANESLSPSFDPHVGWPQQDKLGDYFDMISYDGGAHVAWAGTFNGEQDVYYTYISRGLAIGLPNGVPSLLKPGQPTEVLIQITEGNEHYIPGTATMYFRYDGGAFQAQALEPLGNNRFRGVLPAARCDDEPQFYFTAQGDQSGLVSQPPGAPATYFTADVGEIATIYENLLDTNPGWSTEGLWAFGPPTGQGGAYGGPDPTAGYTGLNVYGYNLNGDYENNLPQRHLVSGPIDCTGWTGVHLNFWRWLGVEKRDYDKADVSVSRDGLNWVTVWQNPNSETADLNWQAMDLDISSVADDQPAVRLRWTMGPTDTSWTYCGWNIDDLRLTGFRCVDTWAVGDMNCDGLVDFGDINPFVMALSNPAGYAAAYPNCDIRNGDINGDGRVDFGDINPFVRLLTNP